MVVGLYMVIGDAFRGCGVDGGGCSSSGGSVSCLFTLHRIFSAWCTEMLAVITSDELARDVGGAETMITRHREHRAEIDTRSKDFTRFTHTGEQLIKQGHFLSSEIQGKIDHLNQSLDQLMLTWNQRLKLYEQNHDLLVGGEGTVYEG